MSLLAGIPSFSSGNGQLDRAFRLAMGTLVSNTKRIRSGLLEEPLPCLLAGLEYPSPWTRDAAINVYFAAALLDPEVARNTLLSVLENRNGLPGIGGQYWDRIIWALGAGRLWDVTRDMEFARLAWDVIRRTAEESLRDEFDPEDGLFRGPAVYGDGVSAYPPKYRNPSLASGILRWPAEHPDLRIPAGGGIPMKALSTNCVYEHAFRILARLAGALGEADEPWLFRADELKAAINRFFWNPATGLYDYLVGECDAQESLGLSFAILFDIADRKQTCSILENARITPHGIPCVWPAFPPYGNWGFGRHSGTVWPHIQGFWALAALKAGRGDLFAKELFRLSGHAARDGQFAEIYHPEDGRIYGGIQENGSGYVEWRSCACQTWSAAALAAMVLDGIFGLDRERNGGCAFLPKGLEYAELTGLSAQGFAADYRIGKEGLNIRPERRIQDEDLCILG